MAQYTVKLHVGTETKVKEYFTNKRKAWTRFRQLSGQRKPWETVTYKEEN